MFSLNRTRQVEAFNARVGWRCEGESCRPPVRQLIEESDVPVAGKAEQIKIVSTLFYN